MTGVEVVESEECQILAPLKVELEGKHWAWEARERDMKGGRDLRWPQELRVTPSNS